MKYLKKYNEAKSRKITHKEEVKSIFTPLINWELIDDVKEMALEYFDYKLTLNINISARSNRSESDIVFVMCFFNHTVENSYWQDINFDCVTIDNNGEINLKYEIFLSDERFSEETADLVDRIKSIYPSENIVQMNEFTKGRKQMKYKLYEAYDIPEGYADSLINWDFINDAKEMSLEFLDEGLSLHIITKIGRKGQKTAHKIEIYKMLFNHNEFKEKRQKDFYTLKVIKEIENKEVEYLIYIEDKFSASVSKYEHELIHRLESVYPDEIII